MDQRENEKGTYFQIDRIRNKINEDTFETNTLLRQNSASNDSSKTFGGYRPSEIRYGHDYDVQGSKRRKTNRKLTKPRFLSGR